MRFLINRLLVLLVFFFIINKCLSQSDNISLLNLNDSINSKSLKVTKPKLDLSFSSGVILIIPFITLNLRILMIDEISFEAGILGSPFSKELSRKIGMNFHLNDFSISTLYYPSNKESGSTSAAIMLGKIPIHKPEKYHVFYRGGIAFVTSGKEGGAAPVFEIGIMYNIN